MGKRYKRLKKQNIEVIKSLATKKKQKRRRWQKCLASQI